MTTFSPPSTDHDTPPPREQPRAGYVVSALSLLAMLGITVLAWPDMAEHLLQEQSRRQMLFEPHKALGNAIAPVVLLVVVATVALAPDGSRWGRRSLLTGAGPAERRRMLDVTLILTALLLLGVHVGVVWTYLGHELDPARVTAWCLSAVLGFVGLMVCLGAFPATRPAAGVGLTGALMVLTALAGAALSFEQAIGSIVLTSVALAVGLAVVVTLHLRRLARDHGSQAGRDP